MTQHDHREYVEGCYRCELSRDEELDAERERTIQRLAIVHRVLTNRRAAASGETPT